MDKNKSIIYLRDVPKKTKATLEEIASQQGLSLNKYVGGVLELVAKDQLILEIIENQHITISENTKVLNEVKTLLLALGGEEDV